MEDYGFFHARPDAIENVVLNCYRLAERFHVDPDVFLNKPITQIGRHLIWLDKVDGKEAAEQAWQEKLRGDG